MASLKKCQRGGDKDILRAGKGNLSDKCGHLPPSNHPQTAVLAQQSFSEKIVFLLAGKASLPPLFTLAAGAVRSSRNRFFGDFVRQKRGLRASQRFPCQPVMTLLDNIGHLVRRCSIVSDWSHFSHDLLHCFKLLEFKKRLILLPLESSGHYLLALLTKKFFLMPPSNEQCQKHKRSKHVVPGKLYW